jgi:DNA-binding GntR family transcriptional regulator
VNDSPSDLFRIPKRITMAETIADSVAKAIAVGVLAPDERVKETALAERVGVSRAPIREALKILHAQGIVTADSSRGFRVARFDQATIEKVLEVRLALEAILLRDAILIWRNTDPKATVLDGPISRMRTAAANNDRASSLEADLSFHRAIADAATNNIAQILWSAIERHVMIIFSLQRYRDDDLASVIAHHEKFRNFICQQIAGDLDPAALRSELENHLLQVSRMRAAMAKQPD